MAARKRVRPPRLFILIRDAALFAYVALHFLLALLLFLSGRAGAHSLVLLAFGAGRLSLFLTASFCLVRHDFPPARIVVDVKSRHKTANDAPSEAGLPESRSMTKISAFTQP
ncbi:MAG: hypothetical protein KY475_16260 [Planctomycetes bacterium]|nr:hypothetical protein [Planctomycetota bacterium]